MELRGCLQQELEPGQLWLDIAGESFSSSFEFDGFVLDMDKQEPTPRAGSSRGRQPAEKKSDQRPARSDGGARSKSVKSDQCSARSDGTRPKASKSDGGQILKKEGKNLSYLHKDTSSSRSRRASSVSRSGKSPSRNTRDDVQLLRPRPSPSPSPSPGSRDLGPASGAYNSSGSGSEMADGRSSLPMTARRASKRSVEGYPKSTVDDAPTGLEILSRQKVKHVEADERMQQISQGVIKVPDSLGGKSITENRLDCLDNHLIQVESYLEMIANKLCSEPPSQDRYRPREEKSYETSPRKKRKIEPENDYVSDDDRVSVMASDEFEEAEEEAQPQQDYASRVFNPEPIDKDKWEPHEAIVNYVNRHFSKMFSNTVKSVIKEEVGVPNINNFVVPEINPQILNSDKVQANKNILEGDNRVGNIQEFILSASFPLLKLWQSIISSDEDLEAEEVLDRVQQSLFCMGSAFPGLNLHRKKRFKSVLTKEFSALADEEGKSSELSGYLFGEDLSEKIEEQLESNRITRRVVVGEDKTKGKSVNAAHRKPFSLRRKRVVRRPSYRRRSQKGTAFSKSMQTQTATKL